MIETIVGLCLLVFGAIFAALESRRLGPGTPPEAPKLPVEPVPAPKPAPVPPTVPESVKPKPVPAAPKPAGIDYGKWPDLVRALIQVESDGYDKAIGDRNLTHKAYGPLQIRKPYTDDVNRVFGTKLTPQMMLGNRQLSIDTFYKYMAIYATRKQLGIAPTYEIISRIHNGGPSGWKRQSTLAYWRKVQKLL